MVGPMVKVSLITSYSNFVTILEGRYNSIEEEMEKLA